MKNYSYCIRLHGTFSCVSAKGETLIFGAKHQALLALLAASPDGVRTRAFLQSMLWSLVEQEHASASLRSALSAIRRTLNDGAEVLQGNRERVWLDMDKVQVIWPQSGTPFLEGLDLRGEDAWEEWLRIEREAIEANTRQLHNALPVATLGQFPPETTISDDSILPLIAVLPFSNRHNAEEKDLLGHLVSERISRTLSRNSSFSVVSHLSTRDFGSSLLSASDINKHLNAQYLMTGSYHLSGNRVVFEIDLHAMGSQRIIWSREFVALCSDILSGESDLVGTLAAITYRSIVNESVSLIAKRPIPTLESHELLMSGIALMQRPEYKRFITAGHILQAVVERVPNHPMPLAWLANWHTMQVNKGYSLNISKDFERAEELADQALSIDPYCAFALTMRGMIANFGKRDLGEARGFLNSAIEINPSEPLAHLHMATTRAFEDDTDDAVQHAKTALRLSPLDPQLYLFKSLAATAHLAAGDLEEALGFANASLELNCRHPSTLRVRTIALQQLGRDEEARESLKGLRKVEPQLTCSGYLARHPSGRSNTGRAWADALRDAGLPN